MTLADVEDAVENLEHLEFETPCGIKWHKTANKKDATRCTEPAKWLVEFFNAFDSRDREVACSGCLERMRYQSRIIKVEPL